MSARVQNMYYELSTHGPTPTQTLRACARAMRPGMTVRGETFLVCPKFRSDPGARARIYLHAQDLQAVGFPRVFGRQTSIAV